MQTNKKVEETIQNVIGNLAESDIPNFLDALNRQVAEDAGNNRMTLKIQVIVEKEGSEFIINTDLEYEQKAKFRDRADEIRIDPDQPDLPGIEEKESEKEKKTKK